MVGVTLSVFTAFFTNHYVFRWRNAMNDFYLSKWDKLRHIEGASQRVQEDTMRFANILEGLGVALINSVMTLVVFLPILSLKGVEGKMFHPMAFTVVIGFWGVAAYIALHSRNRSNPYCSQISLCSP